MKTKLSLKEVFQQSIVRLGIKEIFPAAWPGKELTVINVRIVHRIPVRPQKNNDPAIVILTPRALRQLSIMQTRLCLHVLEDISAHNVCLLLLSNSLSIPVFLKKHTANYDIPSAASKYDEHYLRSLLIQIIREIFLETISLHGVLLEAKGKGILITGSSGCGKTTAALKAAAKDCYWVADDIAVVKRNKKGELIACGNKKISRYIHTETTGIIPIGILLNPDRIKVKTKLAAVIRIENSRKRGFRIEKGYTEILGIKLTSFHINITSTGFFDENLLKKVLIQLFKDN
jgi:serine kinase of HPr protein (carbohydrate metabolism regulator)